jgi:hypothetical protein
MASVAAYTVLFTLLLACAEHLAEPSALSRALAAHHVIPATATIAWSVTVIEGLLGVAGIVALLDGGGRLLAVVLATSCALLALYAGYGLLVLSMGRSGPCGCSRLELPMTGWVVARAAILAGMALLAFLGAGAIVSLARPGVALAIVLTAAATFTLLLWHLPAAMHEHIAVHSGHTATRGGLPG